MLKKIILILLILMLIVLVPYLLAKAPYHIYTLTLTEGVQTSFLEMKKAPVVYYDGELYKELNETQMAKDSAILFKLFHFQNFVIPVPIDHPIYTIIPQMKIESNHLKLGVNYFDQKNNSYFSFIIENPIPFKLENTNQKIFLLPYFRNYILKKGEAELWENLFLKKMSLPSNEGKGILESMESLNKVSYQELVYNLFVMQNRELIFPQETKKLKFQMKGKIGIIELPSISETYLRERLYFYENGILYPMTIETNLNYPHARYFRNRFLDDIKFKQSEKDDAVAIYAEYKGLDYKNRVSQKGMAYLYIAWTHDLNNSEFIKSIILFLERGSANVKWLKPFYDYARKNFGSNFSTDKNQLLESQEEKLKRKMSEELDNEIKKESETSINRPSAETDSTFQSNKEKIDYYLKEAKDLKDAKDESKKNELPLD